MKNNVILPAKEFFEILNKAEQQTIQNAIMKINMDLRKHLECPKRNLFIYYPGNFGTDVSLHTMHIIKNLISSAGYYVTMSETQRDGLSMTIDLNKTLEILKRDGLVVGIETEYDESTGMGSAQLNLTPDVKKFLSTVGVLKDEV